MAAELEALAIHKALAAVPGLPPNTFLTVNVSPHLLGPRRSSRRWPPAPSCTASSSN